MRNLLRVQLLRACGNFNRFGKAGHGFKEFSSIHQMDCRNPNELYVAEITAFRVQKILLKPQQPSTAADARREK